MTRHTYSPAVTDAEWHYLAPHGPAPQAGGRPRRQTVRGRLNAIFSGLRSGGAWRLLPHDVPPWQAGYHDCRPWRRQGIWDTLHHALHVAVRVPAGSHPQPRAGLLDSQSVNTTMAGGPRGDDGGKKVQGRQRPLLVDPQGLLIRAVVHPAAIADRDGARRVLASRPERCPRVRHGWGDRGDRGELIEGIKPPLGWRVEGVKRPATWGRDPIAVEPPPMPAFTVLPRRWVVERTFAWLVSARRLAQDDEELPATGEAFISRAMSRVMVKRLAHEGSFQTASRAVFACL
jgi:putative transposase